jgi:MFS family permease
LLGIILGWISVLFGKMVLLLIAVILIALGVAVCFFAFLPLVSIIVFAIVVLVGIHCYRKQHIYNDICYILYSIYSIKRTNTCNRNCYVSRI